MFTGPKIKRNNLLLSLDALNYKSYVRDYNLLDDSTWTLGTGSVGGFPTNGWDGENHRVIDIDPWGNEVVVWECRPDGGNNGDGGWNGNSFPIDNTKTYRFSVWMRRTVIGDTTSYYMGLNGYGATSGVYQSYSAGALETNPYFVAGGWPRPENEWVLLVGHVHPQGTAVGTRHEDSGVFNVSNGKLFNTNDFIWHPDTTTARHRSYLYYSSTTDTRQQMVYPRVDLCDGTEPSIDDLLNAKGKKWDNLYGKNKLEIIGPKWNPEGYFSFRGNGEHYTTVKGDRISGFGSVCDTRLYNDGMSVVWWQRFTGDNPNGHGLLVGSSTIRHVEIRSNNLSSGTASFRSEAGTTNNYSFGSGTIPGGSLMNRWTQYALVFDFTTSPRTVRWYCDGELFYTHTDFDNSTAGTDEYFSFNEFGGALGNTTYPYCESFQGDLAKMDIYKGPLSSNEVSNNFNAFRKRFGI